MIIWIKSDETSTEYAVSWDACRQTADHLFLLSVKMYLTNDIYWIIFICMTHWIFF